MVFVSIYNITEPCEGAVGGRFASYGLQLFTTVLLRESASSVKEAPVFGISFTNWSIVVWMNSSHCN